MSKESPFPWRTERGIDGWEVYDARGDPVASVGSGYDGREAQEAANAAFIAAAPEMHCLLEEMAAFNDFSNDHGPRLFREMTALLARIAGKDPP